MPHVELAPEVLADFERILRHLEAHDAESREERIAEIVQAIGVLELNPHIGRRVQGELRELVIGRRGRGHAALYRYVASLDKVIVLAVRSQREAGYPSQQK